MSRGAIVDVLVTVLAPPVGTRSRVRGYPPIAATHVLCARAQSNSDCTQFQIRVIPAFVLHSIRIRRRVATSAYGHQKHALSFYPDMASVLCVALTTLIGAPATNLASLFLPLSDPAAETKSVGGTPIDVPRVHIWLVDHETFALPALCHCPLDSFASPARRHQVQQSWKSDIAI